jgi:hypothetical protein
MFPPRGLGLPSDSLPTSLRFRRRLFVAQGNPPGVRRLLIFPEDDRFAGTMPPLFAERVGE